MLPVASRASANGGGKHLRRLLVQCARVYLQRLAYQQSALAEWLRSLRQRRRPNVVVCALANKFLRIAWAIAANYSRFKNRARRLQHLTLPLQQYLSTPFQVLRR